MSGGPSAASPEGLSGEGGSGDWRRIYGRIEALLPQIEDLAADRARLEEMNRTQGELSEARENALHARLLQAEASRKRWKTAYIELALFCDPKIKELQDIDLKECTPCEDANNSPLKGARTGVENRQNNEDHEGRQNNEDREGITGDLRSELTKLKKACKTLSSQKDKEICALLGVKDILCNQLRTIDKENMAHLKIKEIEAAQATEAAQKLQQKIEEMQLALQDKDNEIGILQAEAVRTLR